MDKFGIFPTPLYRLIVPRAAEMQRPLVKDIVAWRKENEYGIKRANSSDAWHSPVNAFERPAWAELTNAVMAAAGDVLRSEGYAGVVHPRMVEMWANWGWKGSHSRPHNHGASDWSGIYFIECPDGSTSVQFINPRPGARELSHYEAPDEGTMLIFPSWLVHWVAPHRTEAPRFTAAFNFVVRQRPPQRLTDHGGFTKIEI